MTNNEPLPKLRSDLHYQIVEDHMDDYIIFFDPLGYAPQPISIPAGLLHLFNMIDGELTERDLEGKINEIYGKEGEMIIEPFKKLLQYMDYSGFLESERYYQIKADHDAYLESPVRPSICSGSSFPENKEELEKYLDEILSSVSADSVASGASAVVVPHIDFRIGEGAHRAYASGYHALRDSEPDIAVIIGTSHFGNTGHFMFTKKDFVTPLGVLKTDIDLLYELNKSLSFDLNFDEIAHRYEHSIELQAVLVQRFFEGRNLKVLPILAGSFHDYMALGKKPSEDKMFNEFIEKLQELLKSQKRNAIFIASADFAHIGRKFQDNFDAEPILDVLAIEDKILTDSLEKCDIEEFFGTVTAIKDKNKICGISPIYTLLKLCVPKEGKLLEYHQWNEAETKSAVSFASIAYY